MIATSTLNYHGCLRSPYSCKRNLLIPHPLPIVDLSTECRSSHYIETPEYFMEARVILENIMNVEEYERLGRQIIVPDLGIDGQLKFKRARVLVVGAGGLGCPAIAYLAGAGIGVLGIVDPDRVEISNLHRQILHKSVGKFKAESARDFVSNLNPHVKTRTWCESFSADNAANILSNFDIVLDCTDTPQSRYLINDACVLFNKPLISASALKTEGQLAVYNYGSTGPCYRCLFPKPPPKELIGTCGDNGILGPVVGIMGLFQAIEAMKVVLEKPIVPNLSIFSMFSFPQWRQVKIRHKQANCAICGSNPSIHKLEEVDYDLFCENTLDKVFHTPSEFRWAALKLAKSLNSEKPHIVDVRPSVQFQICSLPGSISIPIDELRKMELVEFNTRFSILKSSELQCLDSQSKDYVVVCRFGNDSQEAAQKLRDWGLNAYDLIDGIRSWRQVDPQFPIY